MSDSSMLSSRRGKPGEPGPGRALVVDDEETIRDFVARVLQEHGYQVLAADGGRSALATAAKELAFDVLITDLMMPGMNGDELARQLRTMHPTLKVLYLTGYSDQLFKDKVTLSDGEAFLDKPCSIKGLLEAVSLLTIGRIQPEKQDPQS